MEDTTKTPLEETTKTSSEEPTKTPSEETTNIRLEEVLKKHIWKHSFRAWVALAAMVLSFVSAIMAFIFADTISVLDKSYWGEHFHTKEAINLKIDNQNLKGKLDAIMGVVNNAINNNKDSIIKATFTAKTEADTPTHKFITTIDGSIGFNDHLIDDTIAHIMFFNITTSAVRVMLIILAIYFVQFFFRLYRYHIRLNSFYDSRLNSLLLLEMFPNTDIEKAAQFMSVDQYDFKIESLSFDRILELIKTANEQNCCCGKKETVSSKKEEALVLDKSKDK